MSIENKYNKFISRLQCDDSNLLDLFRYSTLAIGVLLSCMYIEPVMHGDLTDIFKIQFEWLLSFEGGDDSNLRDYYYNILLESYRGGGDTKIKELKRLIYEK